MFKYQCEQKYLYMGLFIAACLASHLDASLDTTKLQPLQSPSFVFKVVQT